MCSGRGDDISILKVQVISGFSTEVVEDPEGWAGAGNTGEGAGTRLFGLGFGKAC